MQKLQPVKALIIDLDGTLADTAPDFVVAINQVRAELDLAPMHSDAVMRMVGKGAEHLILSMLKLEYPEDQANSKHAAVLDRYFHHYQLVNGKYAQLFPGVTEGLQALQQQGFRLTCVTNKSLQFAEDLLQLTGIRHHFEFVFGGDSFARKKPDPTPMLETCRALALTPEQVLAIGDSENDARAARAAGCPVLILPYGYNHGEPIQTIESDGIVDSLMVVAELLASVNTQ